MNDSPIYSIVQVHCIANLLRRHHGITSRAQLRERYDKDADWTAVQGIGPKRAPIMEWLMGLPDEEWRAFTGLED
jgi:hypothetical protein